MKKDRSLYGKRIFRCLVTVLCVLMLCSCKKNKTGEEEVQPTQGTEVVTKGFEEADRGLVKRRSEEHKNTTAVKVGDTDVSMQKAMFLIYSMEVQGNSYASFYESQYGIDYWEMVYDEEGRTTRDVFKEETMDALIQYAVLYDCAIKNGMTLTEQEMIENNAFVEDLKLLMSAEEAERGGFTTENLMETCEWMMLAEKYYGRMTDNLGITKESVRETVNKEDYKEYETEYLYLSTTYYDEEYNIHDESEDVIKAREEKMQNYYGLVKEGASFEDLAAADETLVHNTRTFLEQGDGAEELYKTSSMKLKVGEVCSPIRTEYGIYIVRMLDDDCTKTYEATVEAEYETRRNEAFQAAYEVLLEKYEVSVNNKAWDDIVLGATVSIAE